ncbi:hypothetical protein AURDEDRAFT_18391, partial [Auricularia subglabra TFB-10046 SS5]
MLRASNLRGYNVEGLREKLIATLYADDTTVSLQAEDSYQYLQSILDKWCMAAGACFNTTKTEVIPMGSEEFRQRVVEHQHLNDEDPPFAEGIRVARDGEATRILGTWPGNKVENINAWTVVVDRVRTVLDRWARRGPTLTGRGILSRVVAGGHTQYLAAAQGMPIEVERRLDRAILDFIWDSRWSHPVNMETLRHPRDEGGLD